MHCQNSVAHSGHCNLATMSRANVSTTDSDPKKCKELTIALAKSYIRKENPNEILAQCQQIGSIGDLSDIPHLRKLDLSFNELVSLNGLDKLPRLKNLSAYCCRIHDIEALAYTSRLVTLRFTKWHIRNY